MMSIAILKVTAGSRRAPENASHITARGWFCTSELDEDAVEHQWMMSGEDEETRTAIAREDTKETV